jgi:hypothetical protein
MKSLPFWLRLTIACLVFAAVLLGFQLWQGKPIGKAIFETFIITLVWGICMKYLLNKTNPN